MPEAPARPGPRPAQAPPPLTRGPGPAHLPFLPGPRGDSRETPRVGLWAISGVSRPGRAPPPVWLLGHSGPRPSSSSLGARASRLRTQPGPSPSPQATGAAQGSRGRPAGARDAEVEGQGRSWAAQPFPRLEKPWSPWGQDPQGRAEKSHPVIPKAPRAEGPLQLRPSFRRTGAHGGQRPAARVSLGQQAQRARAGKAPEGPPTKANGPCCDTSTSPPARLPDQGPGVLLLGARSREECSVGSEHSTEHQGCHCTSGLSRRQQHHPCQPW